MSRIAKMPIPIPSGVDIALDGQVCIVKGTKGTLKLDVHPLIQVTNQDNSLHVRVAMEGKKAVALSGTMRALIANMVHGVSEGFECCLELRGVGYRAQMAGSSQLNLALGFSHPIHYKIPEGVEITTPSQTVVVIKGIDKQLVGQVGAEIRSYRPPECYKGKGVRYRGEEVLLKEVKKK